MLPPSINPSLGFPLDWLFGHTCSTLAYAYTSKGVSIDETLIREGLATAWTRDGQYRDLLVNLEQDARKQGSGCLW